jgi:hypothetical protein
MTKQRPGKALKPKDKCSKHKRSATIWYRDTGELICFKCNIVIIKGVKKTLKKD